MIHLNKELIELGGLSEKVQGMIDPQTYYTHTISNFLKEKESVEVTGFLKSILWLYTGMNFYRKSCITLNNVRYHRVNPKEAQLEDLTVTLNLPIFNPASLDATIQQQGILDGDRIQEAYILYTKARDYGCLVGLKKIGDHSARERVKPEIKLQDLVHSV